LTQSQTELQAKFTDQYNAWIHRTLSSR
jgi:hypothetical protein